MVQHAVATLRNSGAEADSPNTAVTLIEQSHIIHCIVNATWWAISSKINFP